MNEPTDHELRARFAELRAAELFGAPEFDDVRDRANRARTTVDRIARRGPSRVALSIALAAAIVLAVSVARESHRREFVPPPLSTWTSPTASLLRTPGIDLFTSKTLRSSMLDAATAASALHTGKR